MRKRVAIKFVGFIPRDVCRAMTRLGKAAAAATAIEHPLTVYVVPGLSVSCGDGIGFACFLPWSNRPRIYIAGLRIPEITAAEHIDLLAENLAHELAHYEQFRDGRKLQERGVAMRSRSLLKRLQIADKK